MARGGGIRKMEHGGSHCPTGMMYQNGGCVSMQYGGMTNRTAANTRAGVNAGSRRQTSIRNRNMRRTTRGPNTMLTTTGRRSNARGGMRGGTRRATGTMGRGMTPRMGRTARTATTSYRRGGSVGGGKFGGRSQTNRKGNMKK